MCVSCVGNVFIRRYKIKKFYKCPYNIPIQLYTNKKHFIDLCLFMLLYFIQIYQTTNDSFYCFWEFNVHKSIIRYG